MEKIVRGSGGGGCFADSGDRDFIWQPGEIVGGEGVGIFPLAKLFGWRGHWSRDILGACHIALYGGLFAAKSFLG